MTENSTGQEFYVAVAVLSARVEGKNTEPLYQETFHLIRASDESSARAKAEILFREMSHSYLNGQGETVSWKLEEIVDVALIGESGFEHGSELYTRHFRDFEAYKRFEPLMEGMLEWD